MNETTQELYVRLKESPVVLFLGQDYLRLDSGVDPFLADTLTKYGSISEIPRSYSQTLNVFPQGQADNILAWLHARSEKLAVPPWVKTVASFPWSHVFTSAIDTVWYRSFRSEWRDLAPLFEVRYRPSDIRSKTRLHCTFLFGCVNREDSNERPPLNRRDWLRRKQEALALARYLPEIVTPFGVLLIEGYSPQHDWLPLDDLIPVIDQLGSGQTHLFSIQDDDIKDPILRDLVEAGNVVVHSDGLASFLLKAELDGYLRLGLKPEDRGQGREIRVGDAFLTVPPDIWKQVSRSATILDDSITAASRAVSPDREYRDLLDFLAESSTRPVWSGYQRRFAFKRDFETKLEEHVIRRLKTHGLSDEPIILHGQSGTGKTVALGALAYEIRSAKRCPVLFIARKSQRPVSSDLDSFCKWAEDNGAQQSLIIWDGMLDVEQYYDLLQYLTGRGRKALLVGSCYRMEEGGRSNLVEAPSKLSDREIKDFPEFLRRFDPELGDLLRVRIAKNRDATFLVWLYRMLPPTRSGIRSNLLKEIITAEQQIATAVSEDGLVPVTSLGYALWETGLIAAEQMLSLPQEEIGGERFNEPQELVGLVMVPGRFGVPVPLDLLLRALGKNRIDRLVVILEQVDIFQWYETGGNYYIGPRQSLEAQIIVQSRLGSAAAEVAFARQLLVELRDNGAPDSIEVQFAVDLVRSMGPNGQFKAYFAPHFLEISQILTELREERGVQNPRLMLQEANLIREYVRWQNYSGANSGEAPGLLDRAEAILRTAIELVEQGRRSAKLRSVLLVEWGAVLATRTHSLLEAGAALAGPYRVFETARDLLFEASTLSPEDYHPLDVLAWLTTDLLKSGSLNADAEAELKADILYIFSLADPDNYDPEQRELYRQRNLQLATEIGRPDLAEEAFAELVESGSKAGYFLRALHIAGDISVEVELTDEQTERFAEAVKYLEGNYREIAGDSRCLYLLFRLWWMQKTRRAILYGERQTVAFSQEDWQYVAKLANDLLATEGLYPLPLVKFIQGIAAFHANLIGGSLAIFRQLELESESIRGRRRVIRSFLVSTSAGDPRSFHGTTSWVSKDGKRGEVLITSEF